MRMQFQKFTSAVLLVTILLEAFCIGASATAVTEPSAPTEGIQGMTVPTESISETTAPTQPLETIPEETFPEEPGPMVSPADPETEVYKICDELAQNMQARQILVFDSNTGNILYTKSVESGKLFPASITKLFSTYVALQYLDPNTIITAGDELELVHPGSSIAYVTIGSQLRVKMLVEGMMLPSGNDAAMVLAAAAGRVIAGDETLPGAEAVAEFVDEMNRQAAELGFEKSHFTSPDGWHSGAHYTCLNDLARIAALALKNDTIRRYMRLAEDDTHFLTGQHVIWENTNLLLVHGSGYYRSDAVGMKTGFTRPAGYSLMSAFAFEEGEIVVGLFGYTSKTDRFTDAILLAEACMEQLQLEEQRSAEGVG